MLSLDEHMAKFNDPGKNRQSHEKPCSKKLSLFYRIHGYMPDFKVLP